MEASTMITGMDLKNGISCHGIVSRSSRDLLFKKEMGRSCRCFRGDNSLIQRVVEAHHGANGSTILSNPLSPIRTARATGLCGNNRKCQTTKKVGDWNVGDDRADFQAERDPWVLKEGSLSRGFVEDGSSPPQAVANSILHSTEETEEKLLTALKERRTEDAWQFHEALRRGGMLASQVCLSRLVAQLSLKGTLSSLSRAQRVLVQLQKAKQVHLLDGDSLGLLVMASVRTGAARYALSIIRLMFQMDMCPPVIVWSAVVSQLGKHPYDAPLALELFDDIWNFLGLELTSESKTRESNEVRHDNDSKSIGSDKDRAGLSTIVNVNRTSFLRGKPVRPDTGAFNAVLNACATLGLVQRAERLLDRMESSEVEPDLLTFNILIKLFAKAEDKDQVLNILQEMEIAGIKPDLTTYNSLVSSFISLGELDEAERLVQTMRQGSQQTGPGKKGGASSTDIPIKAHEDSEMSKVLQGVERSTEEVERAEELPEGKGQSIHQVKHLWKCTVKPNVRTYTILMNGYVKNGRLRDAVQLLIAMQNNDDSKSHPNEVTYTTIITAFVNMGLMDEAKSVLLEMVAQKVPANLVTYNVLLKGYCNAGQVSTAYEVIGDMMKAGLAPDVVSYNTLINGCIQRDDNVGALEVFREMRRARIAPSEISYTTVMNAFARNGQPQLVAEVFQEMRTHAWMRVDVIAWNVLIDGYCRAGQMDAAKETFTGMKKQGFHPSVATYGSLVKGFSSAGQAGEVLVLWKEIQERMMAKKGDEIEPLQPDGGLLDCLVDTCLRAGFFQKAMEVVACMEGQGILADKTKYKRMFIELYSTLYTSKHASEKRRAKSAEKRSAVDAFKFWLGLPNKYYQTDWDP